MAKSGRQASRRSEQSWGIDKSDNDDSAVIGNATGLYATVVTKTYEALEEDNELKPKTIAEARIYLFIQQVS